MNFFLINVLEAFSVKYLNVEYTYLFVHKIQGKNYLNILIRKSEDLTFFIVIMQKVQLDICITLTTNIYLFEIAFNDCFYLSIIRGHKTVFPC